MCQFKPPCIPIALPCTAVHKQVHNTTHYTNCPFNHVTTFERSWKEVIGAKHENRGKSKATTKEVEGVTEECAKRKESLEGWS